MDERGRLERLSQLDASNLRVEDRGLPMHVAALVILDQTSMAGPPAQLDLETLRTTVERRLHQVPRLREMLHRPWPGLGPPVWVDDPSFDIRQHVCLRAVPAPGDEPALLTLSSASVAASLRGPSDQRAEGNRVGIMIVPLPLEEADPARRLAWIAAATAKRKRKPPYQPNTRLLQRWMVRAMSRQRMVNLFVSNVPGPPKPLYVAGAQIVEIFQIGAVQGNVTISVGAFSYAGQLNFGVVGDPDAVPDLALFADGIADTLDQLGSLAGAEDGHGRTPAGDRGPCRPGRTAMSKR